MGKYPAHTDKRRTNWCESLFHLQFIPASVLGLTHAAEKAASFQPKPWLRAWKASDYACCGKQKSATNFSPQEVLERKAREAGNRSHLRNSAPLPIGKQRCSSSPGEDNFPSLTQKSKSSSGACTPWKSSSSPNAELVGTGHSFWLMHVCVFFAIFTSLSNAISWGVPKLLLNLGGQNVGFFFISFNLLHCDHFFSNHILFC